MSRPSMYRRRLYATLCFLGCIALIAVEVMTVNIFLKALAVKSWPSTEGTVLRSELESTIAPRNFQARVEYEFEVGGQNYVSTSVRTRGTSTKHKSDALAVVERFPAGSRCTVFYQKGTPEVSYLEAGVGIVNYVMIFSPLLFALFFAAGGWELLKPEPAQADVETR